MKKLILLTFFLLVSSVSALTIDAGGCKTIQIGTTNDVYYEIVNGSVDINLINLTQDQSNITICLDKNFRQQFFTIKIIEESTGEDVGDVSIGSGGGGGSSGNNGRIYLREGQTIKFNIKHEDPLKIYQHTLKLEQVLSNSANFIIQSDIQNVTINLNEKQSICVLGGVVDIELKKISGNRVWITLEQQKGVVGCVSEEKPILIGGGGLDQIIDVEDICGIDGEDCIDTTDKNDLKGELTFWIIVFVILAVLLYSVYKLDMRRKKKEVKNGFEQTKQD